MGFKTIRYNIPHDMKATHFLLKCGYSKQDTQRLLDKKRVRQNNAFLQKGDMIFKGVVEILSFIPKDMGLIPFFARVPQTHTMAKQNLSSIKIEVGDDLPHFCLFNKPAKFLTHPKNLADSKSILDALRYHFGNDCNPCHRLDYETSGLLLCAINKQSEIMLKNLFLKREVNKIYIAIVRGEVANPMYIESDIAFAKDFGNLCIQGVANNLKITEIKNEQVSTIINGFLKQTNQTRRATSIMQPLQIFENIESLLNYLANNAHFFPLQSHNINDNAQNVNGNMDFWDTKNQAKHYESWLSVIKNYHVDSKNDNFIKTGCYNANDAKNSEKFSLVKLMPLSGKTHQLRIHTSSTQHAILGDTLYGLHSVFASFFLDIQSKRAKNSLNSYLHATMSKLHSSSMKKPYAIYANKVDKNIAQKMLFYHTYFFKKDSKNSRNKKSTTFHLAISISLSKILMPCFFSHNPLNEKDEDIFFKFLLFYYGLPNKQEQIIRDMRLYYCHSERLLLHALELHLLDRSFICP